MQTQGGSSGSVLDGMEQSCNLRLLVGQGVNDAFTRLFQHSQVCPLPLFCFGLGPHPG